MADGRWISLKPELLKDWWTPSQACHIYANMIETTKDGMYGKKFIEPKHRGLHPDQTQPMKDLKDQWLGVWEQCTHEAGEKEYYRQGSKEFYTKEYCIRWAIKKRIVLPWFDWAIEEELIQLLDVVQMYPEAPVAENVTADASFKSNQMPIGDKKEKNLLRLIYVLKDLLQDDKLKKHFPFVNQEALADYIDMNFNAELPNKGLSAKGVQRVLADANKVKQKDIE